MAYDAVVVGAGPNGLAAAALLAREGCRVALFEASATPGGGARSEALTLPGFVHDLCSAVHPLARVSPWLRALRLEDEGLEWIAPEIPLAHPLERGAVLLERSLDGTAEGLPARDRETWRSLFGPLAAGFETLLAGLLGPPLRLAAHPLRNARFALLASLSASALARRFTSTEARALLAGMAGHSGLPLERSPSASFALALTASAHAVGWPFPRGGAQSLADALVRRCEALGVQIVTDRRIDSLRELPPARAVLLDLTPRQVAALAGDRLPDRFRRRLERYRYGPGAFKVDWALEAPIPWRDPACARAGTLHLGGSFEEIAASEAASWRGRVAKRPFVILAQPTLFDPFRAPAGRHVAWAYCHVPPGSSADAGDVIEQQIERFAPGFRDVVLARHTVAADRLSEHNPNLVAGDVNGGVQDWRQLLARPTWRLYSTPQRGLYLCSASTPPGGGVHGMCGYHAGRRALRFLGNQRERERAPRPETPLETTHPDSGYAGPPV